MKFPPSSPMPKAPKVEPPSKQYRTSPYTVRQYSALPYAERIAVDAGCDAQAGISYTTTTDKTTDKAVIVGRRTIPLPDSEMPDQPATTHLLSPQLTMLFTDSTRALSAAPEVVAQVQPISVPAPTNPLDAPPYSADLLTVVSEFTTLTEAADGTEWTHWGASPLTKSEGHRIAINANKNIYKCFGSGKAGGIPGFVMALKKFTQPQAIEWLSTNFPLPAEPQEATLLPAEAQPVAAPAIESGISDFIEDERLSPEEERAAATPTAPSAGTIYHTTDYELFHLLPENRAVDAGHVRKLVAMIKKTNLLHIKPLDVTADMGVIDGQHRLAAARELGLPVYYKVSQELSEADITTLNVAQKNWTGADWLHYWTVKGRTDYQAMTSFMKRHPKLSFSNTKLMLGETAKAGSEEFRAGRWKAGQAYKAEQVAILVERIADEVPTFRQPNHSGFVAALYHCVTNVEGFDPKEFMRTILLQPRALVPCASHKQFMETFDAVYNYRKTEAHRVNFQ